MRVRAGHQLPSHAFDFRARAIPSNKITNRRCLDRDAVAYQNGGDCLVARPFGSKN